MVGELCTSAKDTLTELLHPEIYRVRRQIRACQDHKPLSIFTYSQPYIDFYRLAPFATMRLCTSNTDTSSVIHLPLLWIVKGHPYYGRMYTAINTGERRPVIKQWMCPHMLDISHLPEQLNVPEGCTTTLEILHIPKTERQEEQSYIDPWCLRA